MPPADHVEIEIGTAAQAAAAIDPICRLYDEVFSQPPFFWRSDESELHRERLARLLDDPSFGAALARRDDRLIGFAYGFTLPSESKRWISLTDPVPAELAAEWPGRTFVLFDFAVEVASRGQRIGKRLHDGLLGSRHEDRATLTVQPTAFETKARYERWQWQMVGQIDGGPTGAAPVFDVYVRPSLTDLRSSVT